MNFETYEKESARTASGEFHGEILSPFYLKSVLTNAIHTVNIVDAAKKGLFYGKKILLKDPEGTSAPIDPSRIDKDLLHAAMGVLTEAGEILEALVSAMEGKPLDRVNLVEEMGDIEWYMALFYRTLGTTPEEVREINIRKLRARFPVAFTEDSAINRDVEKERTVLESSQEKSAESLSEFLRTPVGEVIEGIVKDAEKARKNSESYKNLFAAFKDGGLAGAVFKSREDMIKIVLDLCSVIEEKTGKRVGNNLFDIFMGLPLVFDLIEKDVREKEGYVCCMDKTRFLLKKHIYRELGLDIEVEVVPSSEREES